LNTKNWKDIAELIGIGAIVASLVFVGLEMRQSRDIAMSELLLAYMQASEDARRDLNDHMDLWVRANNGEEISIEGAAIIANLVNDQENQAFFLSTQLARLGSSTPDIVVLNFARWLHKYPAARTAWQARKDANSPYQSARDEPLDAESFNGKVREMLERYDRSVDR